MDYGYDYGDGMAVVMAVLGVFIFIAVVVAFIWYIFKAIGLYKIAKNRGYNHAWLAFIPVANNYLLGVISDNISAYRGKKTYFGIIMLILSILSAIMGMFYVQGTSEFVILAIMQDAVDPAQLLGFMASMGFFSLVALTNVIFCYICLYKVYSDYAPKNAVLFTVLTVLFAIDPFFLFSIRNKPSMSIAYAAQGGNNGQPPYNGGQTTYSQPQPPQPQQPMQPPQPQQPQQPSVENQQNQQ